MLVQATRLDSRRDRNPPHSGFDERESDSRTSIGVAKPIPALPNWWECILHIWRRCSASLWMHAWELCSKAAPGTCGTALGQSEKTLGTIAPIAGFYDQCHFAHHFKLRFGITPGDFRADLRRKQVSNAVKKTRCATALSTYKKATILQDVPRLCCGITLGVRDGRNTFLYRSITQHNEPKCDEPCSCAIRLSNRVRTAVFDRRIAQLQGSSHLGSLC